MVEKYRPDARGSGASFFLSSYAVDSVDANVQLPDCNLVRSWGMQEGAAAKKIEDGDADADAGEGEGGSESESEEERCVQQDMRHR